MPDARNDYLGRALMLHVALFARHCSMAPRVFSPVLRLCPRSHVACFLIIAHNLFQRAEIMPLTVVSVLLVVMSRAVSCCRQSYVALLFM